MGAAKEEGTRFRAAKQVTYLSSPRKQDKMAYNAFHRIPNPAWDGKRRKYNSAKKCPRRDHQVLSDSRMVSLGKARLTETAQRGTYIHCEG